MTGFAGKVLGVLKKPVEVVEKGVEVAYRAVPEAIKTAIVTPIESMLCLFRDGSTMTVSSTSIYRKIGKLVDSGVQKGDDFLRYDIRDLDSVALDCVNFNTNVATVEGGVTGATGLPGLIADIPALYGLVFRVVQEVALCYGFRVDTPIEKRHLLKIIEIGHETDAQAKREGMSELTAMRVMLRRNVPWRELEKNVLIKAMRELAKKLGVKLTKRKLAQVVVVLGAFVGLAMNRRLVYDVGSAAYYAYRLRFLEDLVEHRRKLADSQAQG